MTKISLFLDVKDLDEKFWNEVALEKQRYVNNERTRKEYHRRLQHVEGHVSGTDRRGQGVVRINDSGCS